MRSKTLPPGSSDTPPSNLPVSNEVDHKPDRARDDAGRPVQRDHRPAAQRLTCEDDQSQSGHREDCREFRAERERKRERTERKLAVRRPEREVHARDQERRDDQVVERRGRLEHHDREGRIGECCKDSGSRIEPEAAGDPRDRDASESKRDQLHEAYVAVAAAEDHRCRRLDLCVRREYVDSHLRNVRDVGDRVLLLPESAPREVVEHGVGQALRDRQRDREEICLRDRGEPGKECDDRIPQRVSQLRERRPDRWRRWPSEHQPSRDGPEQYERKPRDEPTARQPVTGRKQKRDTDDLGRSDDVGGEQEPDRRSEPEAACDEHWQ